MLPVWPPPVRDRKRGKALAGPVAFVRSRTGGIKMNRNKFDHIDWIKYVGCTAFYSAWYRSKRPRPVNFVPVFRRMIATFNDKEIVK